MRRNGQRTRLGRMTRGFGVEHQQDLITAAIKQLPVRLLLKRHEPQNVAVEGLGGREIGGIKNGFKNALRLHVALLCPAPSAGARRSQVTVSFCSSTSSPMPLRAKRISSSKLS